MPITDNPTAEPDDINIDIRHTEALLQTGALQRAIFNSANFSSIATDANSFRGAGRSFAPLSF